MKLLQINYRLSISREEFTRSVAPVAAEIAEVPGLKWKIWIHNGGNALGGGIYLFEDADSVAAFLNGPIIAALQSHPAFAEVRFNIFDVLEEPTLLTRGPIQ